MPNRILREGILSSERIEALSWFEEVFYRRLLSVADDYGRYTAHGTLLRAALFPLRLEKVTDEDVRRALAACEAARLIRLYQVGGKQYLEVLDFRQQVRRAISKWPSPENPAVSERPNPLESDIEGRLCEMLESRPCFLGLQVSGVRRQVRVGESYIDLLLETDKGECVVELKRHTLGLKALEQLRRYLAAVPGSFGILAGTAVAPGLTPRSGEDIALVVYTDDLQLSVVWPSESVKVCEVPVSDVADTGNHAISQAGKQVISRSGLVGVGVGVVFGGGDVCESDARARAGASEQAHITPEAILAAYPATPNGSALAALHLIGALIGSGEASPEELLAGTRRFAAFVAAGGRSDPTRVMGPDKFYVRTKAGEPAPWAKPWRPPAAKSNGSKPYVPPLTVAQLEEAEQLKLDPPQYRALKGLPQ